MARFWYQKAADGGMDTMALNSIAALYEKGLGVEKNMAKAIEYYRKSSDQGNEDAKDALQRLLQR